MEEDGTWVRAVVDRMQVEVGLYIHASQMVEETVRVGRTSSDCTVVAAVSRLGCTERRTRWQGKIHEGTF